MIELRKQPRQDRSRAKVDGILAAAADLCSGRGLDALTTNAVAARAGVSIGSLYQYFPGKAALLAALIRAERANLLEAVERIVSSDAASNLTDLVDELIEATVAHYLARPSLSRTLNLARSQLPPEDRQRGGLHHGAQRKAGLHLPHPRQAAQVLAVDAGEVLGVLGHHLQQVIRRPRHQVAFQHVRHPRHLAFEGVQQVFGLGFAG
jgi:AcrR family transcriptional regulator